MNNKDKTDPRKVKELNKNLLGDIDEDEVDNPKAEMSQRSLGQTCKAQFGGDINDEFIKEFRGQDKFRTVKEMTRNDPLIGGILFTIKNFFRNVNWRVKGGNDEARNLVKTSLFSDMKFTFGETISSILTFLPYGFFTPEMVFKRRDGEDSKFSDGKIGFDKIAPRPQESIEFCFDEDGNEVIGVEQRHGCFNTQFIPRWKILHFRTEIGRNNKAQGISIFRHAFRPWQIKKRIENLEAIGVERDLAGIPIAWLPPEIIQGETQEDVNARNIYRDLVVNIRRDEQEGILFPMEHDENGEKRYDLSLLGSDGSATRQLDTTEIITRWDVRIAQSVLMDFIMLGASKRGSFSLAKSKVDMFIQSIEAFLDIIQDVFNRKAIPVLLELNGLDKREAPRLEHGEIDPPTIQQASEILRNIGMAGSGVFPDQEITDRILGKLELDEDEENLEFF